VALTLTGLRRAQKGDVLRNSSSRLIAIMTASLYPGRNPGYNRLTDLNGPNRPPTCWDLVLVVNRSGAVPVSALQFPTSCGWKGAERSGGAESDVIINVIGKRALPIVPADTDLSAVLRLAEERTPLGCDRYDFANSPS
jgi:hypothetical protein